MRCVGVSDDVYCPEASDVDGRRWMPRFVSNRGGALGGTSLIMSQRRRRRWGTDYAGKPTLPHAVTPSKLSKTVRRRGPPGAEDCPGFRARREPRRVADAIQPLRVERRGPEHLRNRIRRHGREFSRHAEPCGFQNEHVPADNIQARYLRDSVSVASECVT